MPTPNCILNSIVRGCRTMFLLAAAVATSVALQAQTTGTLTGRVSDASTRLSLAGTRVSVQGTALETYTGASGDYVLTGVPAGAQTVEFGYIGYGEEELDGAHRAYIDDPFGNRIELIEAPQE